MPTPAMLPAPTRPARLSIRAWKELSWPAWRRAAIPEYAEHVAEVAELDETRTDREVGTQADDQDDEDFSGKEIVEHFKHGGLPRFLFWYRRALRRAVRGAWLAMTHLVTISRVAPA